jgi:hypothetical protein
MGSYSTGVGRGEMEKWMYNIVSSHGSSYEYN